MLYEKELSKRSKSYNHNTTEKGRDTVEKKTLSSAEDLLIYICFILFSRRIHVSAHIHTHIYISLKVPSPSPCHGRTSPCDGRCSWIVS